MRDNRIIGMLLATLALSMSVASSIGRVAHASGSGTENAGAGSAGGEAKQSSRDDEEREERREERREKRKKKQDKKKDPDSAVEQSTGEVR